MFGPHQDQKKMRPTTNALPPLHPEEAQLQLCATHIAFDAAGRPVDPSADNLLSWSPMEVGPDLLEPLDFRFLENDARYHPSLEPGANEHGFDPSSLQL